MIYIYRYIYICFKCPEALQGNMYIIHCLFISLLRKSGIITVDPDLNF